MSEQKKRTKVLLWAAALGFAGGLAGVTYYLWRKRKHQDPVARAEALISGCHAKIEQIENRLATFREAVEGPEGYRAAVEMREPEGNGRHSRLALGRST
ncbi:MAG TPA: hypothetical protein EYP85_11695 [Armatimonadetes bacterium]|nr:hypothetical protein [Armatimonadota bacterium]